MQNIDDPDEMENIDIDFGTGNGRSFLRRLGEAIEWLVLVMGFALAMAYLTPPQRSAEADLFEAQMNGEVQKCP